MMKADSIDNLDKYILYSRGEIIQKLRMLAKDKCLITAHFNQGQESLITAVIDVLKDQNLIALDYGSNEKNNQKLIAAERAVFKTQHHGITAQFTARKITKAKLKGQPVFAVPLPEEMVWVQRRDYYRVRVPLGMPAFCHFRDESGTEHEYRIIDISAGGLSLADEEFNFDLEGEEGRILEQCCISLPEFGESIVGLEIRNQIPLKHDDPGAGQRIGCTFSQISGEFVNHIQRYINHIDAQRKRLEED